jgi:hypothetical protein
VRDVRARELPPRLRLCLTGCPADLGRAGHDHEPHGDHQRHRARGPGGVVVRQRPQDRDLQSRGRGAAIDRQQRSRARPRLPTLVHARLVGLCRRPRRRMGRTGESLFTSSPSSLASVACAHQL